MNTQSLCHNFAFGLLLCINLICLPKLVKTKKMIGIWGCEKKVIFDQRSYMTFLNLIILGSSDWTIEKNIMFF